jgi:hypothetical protein
MGSAQWIGIEHTEVLVDPGKKRGSIQSRVAAMNKITTLAERLFRHNEAPETYVGLFFSRAWIPKNQEEERIALAVASTSAQGL